MDNSNENQNQAKLADSLRQALDQVGLKIGMVVSTHHGLKNADEVAFLFFSTVKIMGINYLSWAPADTFPCHDEMVQFFENSVITKMEGPVRGKMGKYCSQGKMHEKVHLRSFQGRANALKSGDLNIDLAIIAAPIADVYGNASGWNGKVSGGPLHKALLDVKHAKRVIVVTDNLVGKPIDGPEITHSMVDFVVKEPQLTKKSFVLPKKVKLTHSPDKFLIAENAFNFLKALNILHNQPSVYLGSGEIQLTILQLIHTYLKERRQTLSQGLGKGSYLSVKMLNEGTLNQIIDMDPADEIALKSLKANSNHQMFDYTTDHLDLEELFSTLDIVFMGAIQVDTNFNGNVVTASDGTMVSGVGFWQECLKGKIVVLVLPLQRDRVPGVVSKLTTACDLGHNIDVVVTERGIAINPLRKDLLNSVKNKRLPLKSIIELKNEAEQICGVPESVKFGSNTVAMVHATDGTVIDTVKQCLK